MKRIVVGALVLAGLAILGCSSTPSTSTTTTTSSGAASTTASAAASAASSVSSLASNPLVSSLTSGLGLNTTQAVGGAGALLGSAQAKLSPEDWSKVSSAVPGSDTLVSEAKSLTGTTGNFGDVSSLGGTLSKLGLSSSQASALVPAVTGYVSKAAGPEVGSLLAGALK